MYVQVSELPDVVREQLKSVGYGRADISVRAGETYTPAGGSGQGSRRSLVAVCLANGASEAHVGSWGGANMFNPGNAVDLDTQSYPLSPGFVVIEGSQGHPRTYASLIIHPSNMAAMLPAKVSLTARQAYLISAFAGLNSQGRKNQFERGAYHDPSPYTGEQGPRLGHAPSDAELAELAAMGLIKVTRSGAVSITTEGRNARQAIQESL